MADLLTNSDDDEKPLSLLEEKAQQFNVPDEQGEEEFSDVAEVESPRALYLDEYVREDEDTPGMFKGLAVDNYTLGSFGDDVLGNSSALEQEVSSYQLLYYHPHAEDLEPSLEELTEGGVRQFEDYHYGDHLVHYFIPVTSSGEVEPVYMTLESDDDSDKSRKVFHRTLDQSVRTSEIDTYFKHVSGNYLQ